MKVNTLVLKVASRCNLNCTYCYMYNVGDNTYLKQPKFMSYKTVDAILDKIIIHHKRKKLKQFNFVFHGGEPLLMKKEFFYYFIENANKRLRDENNITCIFQLQTNGILLTQEWCEIFNELDISMGISLDGRREDNDKYRVGHKGEGSYDDILKGFDIAKKFSKKRPGFLCVINIDADPEDTYHHFKELNIIPGDFLIPYATTDKPPQKKSKVLGISEATPYADWLIRIFDIWRKESIDERLNIKVFNTLIKLILGKDSSSDNFGNTENSVLLIETDGGIESIGALKLCGNGFTKQGANINTHTFAQALETSLAKLYHQAHLMLPKKCTACPINEVCGGGHIAHRYSKENGFDNPSIYCNDFMKLILHIQNALVDSFSDEYLEKNEFEKVSYSEVREYMDNLDLDSLTVPEYKKDLETF
ncbi:radical SAM protein [Kordia periserrulae]|nr:radical SAM protein [Kordia periserrulae]